MGNALDLAGVIGTWVAAGLGIIALVGIVGPLLVWRASRTDRHKALDALEKTNTDFITKGYKVWSSIRLGRTIKAPMLTNEPMGTSGGFEWNATSKRPSVDSPSWVKLGLILKAYGFNYRCGDSLVIEETTTLLPVNRTWVLLLGIIGGFAKRSDFGKVVGSIRAQQAVPGAQINSIGRDRPPTPGWMTSDLRWASRRGRSTFDNSISDGTSVYDPLNGLTATLYMLSRSQRSSSHPVKEKAFLNLHTIAEIGDIPQHAIPLSHLFWLAVGCIPTAQGKVFSLENVVALSTMVEPEVEINYTASPIAQRGHRARFDEESSDDEVGYNDQYQNHNNVISPNNYILPTTSPTYHARPSDPYGPRGFYLRRTVERNPALEGIAQAVNARFDNVYSLDEIEITDELQAQLRSISGATYVPAHSQFVRLGSNDPIPSNVGGAWFLRREDAQVLAQAILTLPLFPDGYLLGGFERSNARTMLCEASEALPQLLGRMIQSSVALGLNAADKQDLLAALQQMYLRTIRYDKTRLNSRSIFNLDSALQDSLHANPNVNLAVGVLVITNAEFRAMITQSARHIDAAARSSIDLNFSQSRIEVSSYFAIPQYFPIDFDVLCHEEALPAQPIAIPFNVLLMAALKAILRSTFLNTSLNSLPLFKKVMAADELIYFA